VQFSLEALEPIDADLLIWLNGSGNFEPVRLLASRAFMQAHREGREVILGKETSGAFSHGSLLSLNYMLDEIVPALEAAFDGDPATHADDRPEGL
jgi:iron complex transport system substrate-binding protein